MRWKTRCAFWSATSTPNKKIIKMSPGLLRVAHFYCYTIPYLCAMSESVVVNVVPLFFGLPGVAQTANYFFQPLPQFVVGVGFRVN